MQQNQPLALYIHWPFCKSKCPYCDFNSHVRDSVEQERWKNALLQELAWAAEHAGKRRLESIFFGGGTPSLMPPETVSAIIAAACRHFEAMPAMEITLEANPTSVEAEKFRAFRDAGVNRVSLGVQALNATDLAFLGRQHSSREALDAVALAAEVFPRYSFDLIYARPGQTAKAWEIELREALTHARGHVSLYQLTIEENTAFYHAYHAKRAFDLPEESEAARLYLRTQAIMEEAGLPAYEISNHARPGEESLHNLAYWKGREYLGIGPGAHGRMVMKGKRSATQTLKSPERWLEAVERNGHGMEHITPLSAQEIREEWLLMRLRLTKPFTLNEAPPGTIDETRLARLTENGLIVWDGSTLATTSRGRLLLNYVTSELLAG